MITRILPLKKECRKRRKKKLKGKSKKRSKRQETQPRTTKLLSKWNSISSMQVGSNSRRCKELTWSKQWYTMLLQSKWKQLWSTNHSSKLLQVTNLMVLKLSMQMIDLMIHSLSQIHLELKLNLSHNNKTSPDLITINMTLVS